MAILVPPTDQSAWPTTGGRGRESVIASVAQWAQNVRAACEMGRAVLLPLPWQARSRLESGRRRSCRLRSPRASSPTRFRGLREACRRVIHGGTRRGAVDWERPSDLKERRRYTNGFPSVDDVAGRRRRPAEDRRRASRHARHRADRERPLRGPAAARKVLPGGGDWTLLRGDGVLELDLRVTLETDDGALIHMSVVRASSRAAGGDRGARARRARRPVDLLLPDHAALRDRAPEVRVPESPPRRLERRSARRGPHLHDRRDPLRRPWTLDDETFSSLPRSRRSPAARALPLAALHSITADRKTAMRSRPLMTLRLNTAPTQNIGAGPHGTRVTFPITGGSFEGDRLRGKVLPGGDDWTVKRADGVIELDLRITLETDDGALIYMTFEGIRDDAAPGGPVLSDPAALRDRRAEVRLLEPAARRRHRGDSRRRAGSRDRGDPLMKARHDTSRSRREADSSTKSARAPGDRRADHPGADGGRVDARDGGRGLERGRRSGRSASARRTRRARAQMIAAFRERSNRSLNVNVFCHAPARADLRARSALDRAPAAGVRALRRDAAARR